MQVVYKECPPKRRFGVELEVTASCHKKTIGTLLVANERKSEKVRNVIVTPGLQGWQQSKSNTYWHVKYDSTCGPQGKGWDSGWEVASYVGKSNFDIEKIAKTAEYLKRCGIQTNPNCGLHIHVEVKDFNETMMGNLVARWMKLEFILTNICASHRHNNKYCKPLTSRWTNISCWAHYNPANMSDFWMLVRPDAFYIHDNEQKKYTLNTVGIAEALAHPTKNGLRKTVELRLPECLLDYEHISNWTRLFVNFVDGCKDATEGPPHLSPCDHALESLQMLGLHDNDGFYLLDGPLLHTKLWFLRKIRNSPNLGRGWKDEADELIDFISEI